MSRKLEFSSNSSEPRATENEFYLENDHDHYSSDGCDYYTSEAGSALPIRWTAPEALSQRRFSPANDVWSFGIFVVELFTDGTPPYPKLRNEAVVDAVCLEINLKLELRSTGITGVSTPF